MTHMPALICGKGAVKFAATLGRKRAAVIGYTDSVEEKAREIFAGTDTEIRYIASIQREPLIGDIFDNLPALQEFQPDLILAIGGGSVMDVAKGLHLFYENPHLSFADSLKPFALPALGKKAVSVHVPTTSGTGSETSSAAVFIHPETKVKNLLLSNTLIPQYAVIDADFTDHLPPAIQIVSGLDAMCHAIESTTAANSNVLPRPSLPRLPWMCWIISPTRSIWTCPRPNAWPQRKNSIWRPPWPALPLPIPLPASSIPTTILALPSTCPTGWYAALCCLMPWNW